MNGGRACQAAGSVAIKWVNGNRFKKARVVSGFTCRPRWMERNQWADVRCTQGSGQFVAVVHFQYGDE
jgi:hypothetical protein